MSNYQLVKNTEWKEVEINGEIKEIPVGWEICSIEQSIEMEKNTKNSQIPNGSILSNGMIPVVGQEVEFISGYTNNVKPLLATKNNPTIIFGDHSCTLKFITFNYALGGDGTKVFKGNNKVKTNFLFYSIKNLNFNTDGYKRHFSILKEKLIKVPPLQTQSAIASILSEQESIIQDIESLISKYESRFQYLSEELLSGRLRVKEVDGEIVLYKNPEDNWKEVEINGEMKEIPSDWEVDKLINLGDLFAGKRKKYEPTQKELKNNDVYFSVGGEHIGIKQFNLKNKIFVSKDFFNKSTKGQVVENDILIIKDGATTGKNMFVKNKPIKNMLLNEHVYRFVSKNINPFYLYLLFNGKDVQSILEEKINGIIPSLNQENFSQIETSFTRDGNEQNLIVSIMAAQEELINQQKILVEKEKQKFDWLLDNLLSGKYLIKE